MAHWIIDILASGFVLLGTSFMLLGSIGLVRLPDFYLRLHGPAKATTLGVGCILIASIIASAASKNISARELLVLIFLFLTAPVSAHMLAKAASHLHIRPIERTRGQARTDFENPADH